MANKSIAFSFSAFIIIFFIFGIIFAPSLQGATLSGDWNNDLYIAPGKNSDEIIDQFISVLTVNSTTGGISYSSESVFYKDEFHSQEIGADFRIGILEAGSTAMFDTANKRIDYWLNEGSFTLAGARLETVFLLQHTGNSGFGSGLEFGVSGNLADGVSADFTSRFGMEENEAQLLGIEPGSGYTIITSHGDEEDAYGPSQLQYVDSELQVTGMMLGCCEYDITTEFSEANGFEETEFEFSIGGEENPLSFDVDLTFSAQTKSVELHPGINTEWGCFEVYTDLSTPNVDDVIGNNSTKEDTISGLQIEGFGIYDVPLGHVSFSSLTSLAGNLYKPLNTYDMDLRPRDYVIDPQSTYVSLYDETDYDQVFSLYKSGEDLNLTFGANVYFDMSGDATGTDTLFDTGLFTGNGSYLLSDQFTLGAGFAIKPESLETIRLSFDYSF